MSKIHQFEILWPGLYLADSVKDKYFESVLTVNQREHERLGDKTKDFSSSSNDESKRTIVEGNSCPTKNAIRRNPPRNKSRKKYSEVKVPAQDDYMRK